MDSNGDMNSKNGGRIRKPNFLYNIRDYDLGYSDSHSDNVASVGPVGGGETEEVSLQVESNVSEVDLRDENGVSRPVMCGVNRSDKGSIRWTGKNHQVDSQGQRSAE